MPEFKKIVSYLLVSSYAFVHVPHKNLRLLLPLTLDPLPLVSFEHAFPARIHFESAKAFHLLYLDPGFDFQDLVL